MCSDWDKPFDLTDEEKGQFRQVVPLEVSGLQDVLCSNPHTAEVRERQHGGGRQQELVWCGVRRPVRPCLRVAPDGRFVGCRCVSACVLPSRAGCCPLSQTKLLPPCWPCRLLQEVSASKPGMLSAINRILDGQLASYGIHPGRTGLSEVELLAAMKMLT